MAMATARAPERLGGASPHDGDGLRGLGEDGGSVRAEHDLSPAAKIAPYATYAALRPWGLDSTIQSILASFHLRRFAF